MNKISYPQLIKDVADTYRDATGSSEPVVIGELTSKLAEAISNTGSDINIEYKSIIYNEDDTTTLIDSDDIEHTLSCIYEDGKITSMTLDNEEIKLNYNGDDLVAFDDTMIDLSKVPVPQVDGVSIQASVLEPTAILTLDINTFVEIEESEE